MHVWMSVCLVCEGANKSQKKNVRFPGTAFAGGCQPAKMGAGKQTPVLWKNSKCS